MVCVYRKMAESFVDSLWHAKSTIILNVCEKFKKNFHKMLTLPFEGAISGQGNQSTRYVRSCLEHAILIKMSTNNPNQK